MTGDGSSSTFGVEGSTVGCEVPEGRLSTVSIGSLVSGDSQSHSFVSIVYLVGMTSPYSLPHLYSVRHFTHLLKYNSWEPLRFTSNILHKHILSNVKCSHLTPTVVVFFLQCLLAFNVNVNQGL